MKISKDDGIGIVFKSRPKLFTISTINWIINLFTQTPEGIEEVLNKGKCAMLISDVTLKKFPVKTIFPHDKF